MTLSRNGKILNFWWYPTNDDSLVCGKEFFFSIQPFHVLSVCFCQYMFILSVPGCQSVHLTHQVLIGLPHWLKRWWSDSLNVGLSSLTRQVLVGLPRWFTRWWSDSLNVRLSSLTHYRYWLGLRSLALYFTEVWMTLLSSKIITIQTNKLLLDVSRN